MNKLKEIDLETYHDGKRYLDHMTAENLDWLINRVKKLEGALTELRLYKECYCDTNEDGVIEYRCSSCIHRKIAIKALEEE